MKLAAATLSMLAAPRARRGWQVMGWFAAALVAVVLVFAVAFQVLMSLEGRDYSWWSAVYWTLVTMSTLGFGDIVFHTDAGRMFSVLVLLTGAVLILVVLPFTFIQVVYVPLSTALRNARAPRTLVDDVRGHIILTGRGSLEEEVIHRATTAGVPWVLIVEDPEEAAVLHDRGYHVLVGPLDEPGTYRAARADDAALLLAARSDEANTNIVFTAREVTDTAVVTTASSPDGARVLTLAGADHVIQLPELLGTSFARRVLAPTAVSTTIATIEDLEIAEASAAGTELVDRSIAELRLRERFGISVVGLWDRGRLHTATDELRIAESSILLLCGSAKELAAYNDAYAPSEDGQGDGDGHAHDERPPVLVLGGGRVGRATFRALRSAGTPCVIVDRDRTRVERFDEHVVGDASHLDVLRRAGIDDAPAVVITTHDDDTNIYLTLLCRRLREDAQILGRVELERNVSTMHRAGADVVFSYASIGAIDAWNALREDSTLLLADGLLVFRTRTPQRLAGRRLGDTTIAADTGASVIGVVGDDRHLRRLTDDDHLEATDEFVLIGDEHAEERFYAAYVTAPLRGPARRLIDRLRPRRGSPLVGEAGGL